MTRVTYCVGLEMSTKQVDGTNKRKERRYSDEEHSVSDLGTTKISRELWMWAYVKALEMFH